MKKCTMCSKPKYLSEFNKQAKNKDGYHVYCRLCQREWYLSHKQQHISNVRKNSKIRYDKIRDECVERFSSGCTDCGITDIRVLEFDHLGDKILEVSEMIRRGFSISKIKDEMDKCEIRCRNHHAIKTLERLGKSWHDKYMPH